MALNCAAKQETRPARTLFPRIYRFSNPRISSFELPITMTPLLAPSSRQDLQRMPLRKARLANSISQDNRRSPPDGGTPEFLPHRFQIFHFAGATLASPEVQLASQRIRRVQFSVEESVQDEFPIRAGAGSVRILRQARGGRQNGEQDGQSQRTQNALRLAAHP